MKSIASVFALVVLAAALATAADRGDVKLSTKTPVDLADFYVFKSPQDPANTVLILTFLTKDSRFPGPATTLDLSIDDTGNAFPDTKVQVTFADDPQNAGGQLATLTQDAATLATGPVNQTLPVNGGGSFRAGTFDDPFFANAVGLAKFAKKGKAADLAAKPVDAYLGKNVLAIVVEIPSSRITAQGSSTLKVFASVFTDSKRIDRVGRPLVGALLFSGKSLKKFNAVDPSQDFALFGKAVAKTLHKRYKLSTIAAAAYAAAGLPDVVPFDTTSAAGFPNGRRLDDDVVDQIASVIVGAPATDGVANDSAFLATFPYLAPAN